MREKATSGGGKRRERSLLPLGLPMKLFDSLALGCESSGLMESIVAAKGCGLNAVDHGGIAGGGCCVPWHRPS